MKKMLAVFAIVFAMMLPLLAQQQNKQFVNFNANGTAAQGDEDRDRDRDHDRDRWRARLTEKDRERFDSYFSRWMEYREQNDRGQIRSMERRMRGIMARYNIPGDVPFEAIARR